MRIGIGYDLHRLIPTAELSQIPVGGVQIPCHFKITAHSDGDTLLHALVDACLGAVALGDIGQWFSDRDPKNQGRNSVEFVTRVLEEIGALGWRVAQVDSNIFLERPKIAPHMDEIRRRMATMLDVELSQVSVKAKTMERTGAIGEGKAIAAQVVVTVERRTH